MVETTIGDCRWQVILATRQQQPDPDGTGIKTTYANPTMVWADIRPIGTQLFLDGQQLEIGYAVTHRIIIRWRDGLDLFDVVQRQTTRPDGSARIDTYKIIRQAEWQGRRVWTILDAQLETTE